MVRAPQQPTFRLGQVRGWRALVIDGSMAPGLDQSFNSDSNSDGETCSDGARPSLSEKKTTKNKCQVRPQNSVGQNEFLSYQL